MLELTITAILFLILGAGIGNIQGDQATLRDCATRGAAKLVGGGTIDCTVRKQL